MLSIINFWYHSPSTFLCQKRSSKLARRHEETLEALEDIESGRVVGGDEVMAWLASWGKDDELEPPK